MQELSDTELLRVYTEENSEAAFAALVARYVNLVYSAALRKTGNGPAAEEITQAVFIILARKARGLRRETALSGWLYQAARLTAANFLRGEFRRIRHEQEAVMQSLSPDPEPEIWRQILPLLEDAMGRLGERERQAVVQRYFEGKSFQEIGALAGTSENAVKKRVGRALEKLHRYFSRHGVSSTTAIIANEMAANSVQIAPVALAKAVTAAAFTKGAAASTSTATLIKGALKIMAWTKAKTAAVAGACVLLAAGTTTVAVREIHSHQANLSPSGNTTVDDSYFVEDDKKLFSLPANLLIFRKSHFSTERAGLLSLHGNFGQPQQCRLVCAGMLLPDMMGWVYSISPVRVLLPPDAPTGRFDCLATLPAHSQAEQTKHMQDEIARQLGLVGHREARDVDVLLLKVKTPNAPSLKPHTGNSSSVETKLGTTYASGQSVSMLAGFAENALHQPIEDRTGLSGHYDFTFDEKSLARGASRASIEQLLLDQFGLELVPSHEPVEMLVMEKVK